MSDYFRAIARTDMDRPAGAFDLAGGWCWFDTVSHLRRGKRAELIPAGDVPRDVLARMVAPRAAISGLSMAAPQMMGILNVTPDSFSDGGKFVGHDQAVAQAMAMLADGATIIDIGGESTRPGAVVVPNAQEAARTAPVIAAIRATSDVVISIDTRKADVAQAAIDAGATLINDVAAFTYDGDLARVTVSSDLPVCLMHAQGDPATMQRDPHYGDVLLDVYDFLADRVAAAIAAGVKPERIIVDPGIGFGKTVQHNVTLLQGLSLFHSLGCPVLLGASRKRFIGSIGGADVAADRMAGSLAVAQQGVAQGAQILRVHDTFETRQALSLQMAVIRGSAI